MKQWTWIGPAVLLGLLSAAGCEEGGPAVPGASAEKSDKDAAPAALSPADQKLADAQKVCPITGEALGTMGAPVKVTVKDRTVFLCCDGCKKKALDNPDKTLAAVDKAKASP